MDDTRVRQLIARIAQRDEAALADLWRGLSPQVSAFLRTRLDRAQERDEALVDTFKGVWDSAHRFEERSRGTTWILGIARHCALMKLRSRRDHQDIDDPEGMEIEDPAIETDALLDMLHHARLREHLHRCIEQLPPTLREAITLLFLSELSVDHIAELAQVPPGTVKSRVFKAKALIKICLQLRLGGRGDGRPE